MEFIYIVVIYFLNCTQSQCKKTPKNLYTARVNAMVARANFKVFYILLSTALKIAIFDLVRI